MRSDGIAARISMVLLAVSLHASPHNEERLAAACATVTAFEHATPDLRAVIAGVSGNGLAHAARFVVSYEQAGVLIEAGEPEWAEEQLEAAAAASAALDGKFDSVVAERVGDLRRSQWRLDDARRSYIDAFQTPGTDSTRRAGLARKISEAASLSGRMEEALAWNAEAATLATQNPALHAVAREHAERSCIRSGHGDRRRALGEPSWAVGAG